MCIVCNTCFEVWKCKYGMTVVTNVSRSPKVEVNCPINMSIVSQCRRCKGWYAVNVNVQSVVLMAKLWFKRYIVTIQLTMETIVSAQSSVCWGGINEIFENLQHGSRINRDFESKKKQITICKSCCQKITSTATYF